MEERIRTWLEWELKEYAEAMKVFNQKLTRMMYLAMAASVVGLPVLGFGVGGTLSDVLRIHVPVGLGIALFIWLCFYVQIKVTSGKKVRAAYEKALARDLHSPEEESLFIRQIENQSYGKATFMNTVVDKYPCRFLAGENYLLYIRDLNCRLFRVADIKNIYAREEKTRIRCHMGDYSLMQSINVGLTLVIEYKEGSASEKERKEDGIYLENGKQLTQALDLIRKYCPDSEAFLMQ